MHGVQMKRVGRLVEKYDELLGLHSQKFCPSTPPFRLQIEKRVHFHIPALLNIHSFDLYIFCGGWRTIHETPVKMVQLLYLLLLGHHPGNFPEVSF